jgi:CrcB protein
MIRVYALVAAGGAIGSLARFWIATTIARLTGPNLSWVGFPWGTLLVNIAGSLAIGCLAATVASPRTPNPASLQAFAMVGLCGGFTTFSAFSLQTIDLLRSGHSAQAITNIIASVALCLAATAGGYALAAHAT